MTSEKGALDEKKIKMSIPTLESQRKFLVFIIRADFILKADFMNGNRNFIIDKEKVLDNVCKQFFQDIV